jgi:hypothetical protein
MLTGLKSRTIHTNLIEKKISAEIKQITSVKYNLPFNFLYSMHHWEPARVFYIFITETRCNTSHGIFYNNYKLSCYKIWKGPGADNFLFKGIVNQKIRGPSLVSFADIFLVNFKGFRSLNSKKPIPAFRDKKSVLMCFKLPKNQYLSASLWHSYGLSYTHPICRRICNEGRLAFAIHHVSVS